MILEFRRELADWIDTSELVSFFQSTISGYLSLLEENPERYGVQVSVDWVGLLQLTDHCSSQVEEWVVPWSLRVHFDAPVLFLVSNLNWMMTVH
ncbi:hypothetical protein D3C80_2008220 [compost metagenome]